VLKYLKKYRKDLIFTHVELSDMNSTQELYKYIHTFLNHVMDRPDIEVTEYVPNGSLDDFCKNNPSAITPEFVWKMAWGIAFGMALIHHKDILHMDLHSGNVLINEWLDPLITDFGLSYFTQYPSHMLEMNRKFKPIKNEFENCISDPKCGFKIDVYCYGLLLKEISEHLPENPYSKLIYLCMCNQPQRRPDFFLILLLLAHIESSNSEWEIFNLACLSSYCGRIETLKKFSLGALDDYSDERITPLCYAVFGRQSGTVAYLLEKGCPPNPIYPDVNLPFTALGIACEYAWKEIVELLLIYRANPNAKGIEEELPLACCKSEEGCEEIVKLLEEYGAKDQ